MLIKISYYNMKSVSGYDSEESIIKVLVNDGWSSKGSSINYIKYPDIGSDYTSHFVDRYKYGIKFKFLVSGIMGSFNTYNLVTHFVSGKVLLDLCGLLIITFASTFFSNYSKKFNQERIEKIKHNGERVDEDEDIVEDVVEDISQSSPDLNSNRSTEQVETDIVETDIVETDIEEQNTVESVESMESIPEEELEEQEVNEDKSAEPDFHEIPNSPKSPDTPSSQSSQEEQVRNLVIEGDGYKTSSV